MDTHLRVKSMLSLRASAKWLRALDNWREKQPVKPSRSAVIVTAVELFIARSKARGSAKNDQSFADSQGDIAAAEARSGMTRGASNEIPLPLGD
jgi:hypothetical protein